MSRRLVLLATTTILLGSCREQAPTASAPLPRTPAGPNLAPNVVPGALFAIAPRYPAPGDTVSFDGSYSQDDDGQVVQYRWNLGTATQQVTGAVARTVFRTAGTYPISLTVYDDSGDSTTSTFNLTVGTGGAPASAVSAAQSTLTLSAATTAAATPVTTTVTVRNAAGTPLSGVAVAVSALGRNIAATPGLATSDGSGVAIATVSSTVGQASTVRAVADYTAITQTQALTIAPAVVSASQSTIRLTQASLIGLSDTTIVEVTARDANGNVVPNTTVSLAASVAGLTLPSSGTTDANGRWTGVVRMVSLCDNAASTITATAGGTTLASTVAITGTGTRAFGVCGAALWLDASDLSTQTLDGSNRVSQWQDKSGWAHHAVNSTLSEQPASVAAALNGQRVVRFTSAHLLRSQTVLRGITNAAEVFVVASATASQTGDTFLFAADSQFVLNPNERFSAHLPWLTGNVTWDFGTCCSVPGARIGINYEPAGAALPAAQWSFGTMTGSTPERHIRRNGTTLVSDVGTDTLNAPGLALRIGNSWGGDIGELLIFPRALTTLERTTIENGLIAKWFLGTLALTAGNNQTVNAGTSPSTAPQVRVTNAAGAGVSGATVTWTVTSGGGRVNGVLSATSTTDANGYATAPNWVPDVGSNQLTASHGTQNVVFSGTGTLPSGVTLRVDFSTAANLRTGSGCTGTVSNSSTVGCALDLSGNNLHALQPTAGARPTFVSSGLNGRGSLAFSLSSDIYLIVNSATIRALRNTSRSIFAVGRATATVDNATNAGGAIVNWTGYNTGIRFDGHPVPVQVVSDVWQNAGSGGAATFNASPITPNAVTVVSNTVNVVSNTFESIIWANGANASSGGVASGAMSGDADMFIGIGAPATPNYGWRLNGQLGEIIIYARVVSTAERQQLERYLGWKWGVTVP